MIENIGGIINFVIKENPLPNFNAYTLYDVIYNFWILGVIILGSIPYFLFLLWYCGDAGRGKNLEHYDETTMVVAHAVTILIFSCF